MNFIKLKNGNIIFANKIKPGTTIGHGININSPYLKQVNFPLSDMDDCWEPNYEEIGMLCKKTYVEEACNCHSKTISKKRFKTIFYALVRIRPANLIGTV